MELNLSRTEWDSLQATVRQQRGEARLYRRARAILLAVEGESISATARILGTS